MKFTHYKNKKHSVFHTQRFIYYVDGGAHEMAQAATAEITEVADKVESDIKIDKLDPYQALKKAKEYIFTTWETVKGKIAPTKSEGIQSSIMELIKRLDEARQSATEKLDQNLDHYIEVAAFLKKNTDLELILSTNKNALGTIEAQLLFSGIGILNQGIVGFDSELGALNAMKDIGMEPEKKALQAKIGAQQEQMAALKQRLIEYHTGKITLHDEDFADLKKHFEPGFLGSSIVSEKTVRDLYAHLYYLEGLHMNSSDSLAIADLTQQVEDRRKDFETILAKAETRTPMDSTLKQDHNPNWERYKRIRDSYTIAEEYARNIQSSSKSTDAQKQKAEEWLTGIRQSANEQLNKLKKDYVHFRENEGNIRAFENDKEVIDRGVNRLALYASPNSTLQQMKEDWDQYETLRSGVETAKAELESANSKSSKAKNSAEKQAASTKLYHAERQFKEQEQKIRNQYVALGPNDVTRDLYEEKFYDGILRIGTTVEQSQPTQPSTPADISVAAKPKSGTNQSKV